MDPDVPDNLIEIEEKDKILTEKEIISKQLLKIEQENTGDFTKNIITIKQISNNLVDILIENNIPIIPKEKIIKDKDHCIGEGSFGKVYKGKYCISENEDIIVAIKKLKLHQLANVEEIMQEIKAVSKISHERVPKFYGVWKTDKYLHLIFDYINGVTLKEWYLKNNPCPKLKLKIIIELVEVIENMHSQNIIHRDLKPENIMIMNDNVYIIDFGVSKISIHTQTGTNNQKGTVAYFGPENCSINTDLNVSSIITISPKFDIWSIGCIISYIFSNRLPWSVKIKKKSNKVNHKDSTTSTNKELKKDKDKENPKSNGKEGKEIDEKKKENTYEILADFKIIGNLTLKNAFPIPSSIPLELIEILKLCFEYNPNDRISASNLKTKLKEYYNTQE